MCDFSPPRGADGSLLESAKDLDADYICVAYNPGKAVRLDSAVAAYSIKRRYRKDVIFNLSSRDMNKLALQTHLLGASALGLENVVVLKGDDFTREQTSETGEVRGFTPVQLIEAIKSMNEGLDYRGRKLTSPTDFCVGGVADLSKGIESQAQLVIKKEAAGVDFILTQPVYDVERATKFRDILDSTLSNSHLPIFFGVQVLIKGGVIFSDVPENVREDLDGGRRGAEIALEMIHSLSSQEMDCIYLIPPIMKGGARDYQAAKQVIGAFK